MTPRAAPAPTSNTRKLTILAQDPGVRLGGRLAFAQVVVPIEELAPGPVGHRIKVIDFDASAGVLYEPLPVVRDAAGQPIDEFAAPANAGAKALRAWEARLLADPRFHAQNCYAIVARTLARFEFALGRRVSWGFFGHQLHVAPHAFCDANAYYSEPDKALFFGYFRSMGRRAGRTVFTCLSHDIVAHETTHALLDGLRDGFTDPSTPDQAAFHEGFADVVALLSVFSLPEVVEVALTGGRRAPRRGRRVRPIPVARASAEAIRRSILLGLGEEFGTSLDGARHNALRRSIEIEPDRRLLERLEEPHDRGEVFAAAMLRSFLAVWTLRIGQLGTFGAKSLNLDRVVEEGARAADDLLTASIRALDYCPPVDLEFGEYLSALLTADAELVPEDPIGRRRIWRETFASYGIEPAEGSVAATGCWAQFGAHDEIVYTRTNFDTMLHDREEVFRFLWENRGTLGIDDRGDIRVNWVRPATRQGADGLFLRETVCEYVLRATLFAAEAESLLDVQRPKGMSTRQSITAYGGGTLVFDQYGRIKYHIGHRLDDAKRQSKRLEFLWKHGQLDAPRDARSRFAGMHRARADADRRRGEEA